VRDEETLDATISGPSSARLEVGDFTGPISEFIAIALHDLKLDDPRTTSCCQEQAAPRWKLPVFVSNR
jgi:hypothetical protein